MHERDRVAQRKSARERESETFLSKTVLRTLWTLHAAHAELLGVSQAGDTS